MSTEERGHGHLVGWGAGRIFIEELTCELRHGEAHPVKGGEGQREDVQSHAGLKSMARLRLCKSLMMAQCRVG